MPVLTVTLGEVELLLMASTGVGAEGVSTELRRVLEQDLRAPGTWPGPWPAADGQKAKLSVRLADALKGDVERRRGTAELGAYVRGVLRAAYGQPAASAPTPQRSPNRAPTARQAPPPPALSATPPPKVPPEMARLPIGRAVPALLLSGKHVGAEVEVDGLRVRIGETLGATETEELLGLLDSRQFGCAAVAPREGIKLAVVRPGDRDVFVLGAKRGYRAVANVLRGQVELGDLVEEALEVLEGEAKRGSAKYIVDVALVPIDGRWAAVMRVAAREPAPVARR